MSQLDRNSTWIPACAAALILLACQPARPSSPNSPSPAKVEDTTPSPYSCMPLEPDGACCASRFGFDPLAIGDACAFGPFLGERDHISCELHYARGESDTIVRLTERRNRDVEQAWALHRASFGAPEAAGERSGTVAEIPGSHWSSHAGRRWVFLPGWSTARRVSWTEADCDPQRMRPILEAALDVPQPPAEPAPRWSRSDIVEGESLASKYGAREDLGADQIGSRKLPERSLKLVVALISAAARGDQTSARALLSPSASFGLPDRRELDAWPIAAGDNLERMLVNLDVVASRFPAEGHRSCPPLDEVQIDLVARGEAPYWCYYLSEDKMDVLVFRLQTISGSGYVDYVGMYETKPTSPITLEGEPPPPPLMPVLPK